ncbi:MAG: cell division/cell wall cluster transcriptional repressor MraZ [Clostridia bacterium]|nr:cell division/cell wall cluster transcriptional repressor MraZ [Clostridia bacterium]
MEFFSGTVSHQLDAKNRIRIPAKFRAGLGKEIYFVAGSQGCISVFSKEVLEERIAALNAIRTSDAEKMRARRKILGSIEKVTEDDQGRTLLSAFLRGHANVQKDVVTVGMGEYLEIWSKSAYEAYTQEMTMDDAYALVDF